VSWVTVNDFSVAGWEDVASAESCSRTLCEQLENGSILFFESCPFDFPEADQLKLLEHRQSGFRYHKNVSYQPHSQKIRGLECDDPEDRRELIQVLDRYSQRVVRFVEEFLIPYRDHTSIDYASYRPVEEAGRVLSLHKRNDLLHVDAFPNRPTRGGRILRVFTNLNPQKPRIWNTTSNFHELATEFAEEAGLQAYADRGESALWRVIYGAAALPSRLLGKQRQASMYDRFMHRFHNFLKEHSDFQRDCDKITLEFPPRSTWLVYTDAVPHAVLSGQFALEQTFIVDLNAMVRPERAPLRILESLCGKRLVA
jgi:hypothetical protein